MSQLPAAELARLIEAQLHGTPTPAETAALESALRNDPAARRAWRRAAALDSALRDWAGRDDALTQAWQTGAPTVPARRPQRSWRSTLVAIAAAVIALLGAGAGYFASPAAPSASARAEQTDRGLAVLAQAVDAEWAGETATVRRGDSLRAGPLVLKRGVAQIEFFSGAVLLLEGPAELELVSPWRAICRHGKARVRVPPAARGFELLTPGMKLVDLGTEFGVEVDRATAGARVQVFSGEVVAHPDHGAQLNLTGGQGLEQRGATVARLASVRSQDLPSVDRLRELGRERDRSRYERWREFSAAQRRDPRLLAYYAMEPAETAGRLVRNAALPADPSRDGGAVGAQWTQGRWAEKPALEFKRPGDRVRLQIDGQFQAVTLACWVRVDGLDRQLNALLLTDGFEPGEPHWQIYRNGQVRFAIAYEDGDRKLRRFVYESPPLFEQKSTGRWRHLAVTYDRATGEGIHYADGAEVSRLIPAGHQPSHPITFGAAEIGNWGLPLEIYGFPIRNLNGRIDEFSIHSAVLGADEIRAMYEAGRPE